MELHWCHTVPVFEDCSGFWGLGAIARPKKSTSGCKTQTHSNRRMKLTRKFLKHSVLNNEVNNNEQSHTHTHTHTHTLSLASFPSFTIRDCNPVACHYPHFCPLEAPLPPVTLLMNYYNTLQHMQGGSDFQCEQMLAAPLWRHLQAPTHTWGRECVWPPQLMRSPNNLRTTTKSKVFFVASTFCTDISRIYKEKSIKEKVDKNLSTDSSLYEP